MAPSSPEAEVLAEAEASLRFEQFDEALDKGKEAVELMTASSNADGLADALRVVIRSLACLGRPDEGDQLAKDELLTRRKQGDRRGEAKMLIALAEAAAVRDSSRAKAEAIRSVTEARAMMKQQGDLRIEATALLALAAVHMAKEGDAAEGAENALRAASEAKELALELDDKRLEAECLHAMASAQAVCYSPDDALQTADEAFDLYLEIKDRQMEAFELMAMAKWHLQNGAAAKALSDAEDALEIYQALNSPMEIQALRAVFESHVSRGDLRRAKLTASEGLRRFREQGDRRGQAQAAHMLVTLFLEAHRWEEALTESGKCFAIGRDIQDATLMAKAKIGACHAHLKLGNYEKALEQGQEAMQMLKTLPSNGKDNCDCKIAAMQHLVDVHKNCGDMHAGQVIATEMQEHFARAEQARGEAEAFICIGTTSFMLHDMDGAIKATKRAQQMLSEEGNLKREAHACRVLGEIHWRRQEHKAALRVGERARALFREINDTSGEACALFMVAQNCVHVAVLEGARAAQDTPLPRTAREALDKAWKMTETCLKIARTHARYQNVLASVLGAVAQIHLLHWRPIDSLKAADEAILLFRDSGDYVGEANSLMLAGDALRTLQKYKEAAEACEEALILYQHKKDAKGEEMANEVIKWLQQHLQPAQPQYQPQYDQNQGQQQQQGSQVPVWAQKGQQEALEAGETPDSIAKRDYKRGPALDRSAMLDESVVKQKIIEIAMRITNADEGDIEADTPLMEAGLTSASAIILRDELMQELPGIVLPVTLVFDYPSISSMSELIVEKSMKKLKN